MAKVGSRSYLKAVESNARGLAEPNGDKAYALDRLMALRHLARAGKCEAYNGQFVTDTLAAAVGFVDRDIEYFRVRIEMAQAIRAQIESVME